MNITLTGKTVRLEPLMESHREPLRLAAQDERIWEFNVVSGFGEAFDPWFESALRGHKDGSRIPYAVVKESDSSVVGSTSYLDLLQHHRRTEIGHTWYNPSVWATDVNPECKLLLLTHAFESIELNRVSFNVDRINIRSQKAVLKLGAVQEGILRKHAITYTSRIRDTVVFSVIREEWPAVQEMLQKRLSRPST